MSAVFPPKTVSRVHTWQQYQSTKRRKSGLLNSLRSRKQSLYRGSATPWATTEAPAEPEQSHASHHLKPIRAGRFIPEDNYVSALQQYCIKTQSGGRLNIKMSSYQYRNPNVKDKTVSRPPYLEHGNPHTWERRSLYWDRAQSPSIFIFMEKDLCLACHLILWRISISISINLHLPYHGFWM